MHRQYRFPLLFGHIASFIIFGAASSLFEDLTASSINLDSEPQNNFFLAASNTANDPVSDVDDALFAWNDDDPTISKGEDPMSLDGSSSGGLFLFPGGNERESESESNDSNLLFAIGCPLNMNADTNTGGLQLRDDQGSTTYNKQRLEIPHLPATLDELTNQLPPVDSSSSSPESPSKDKEEEDPVVQELINRGVRLVDRVRCPPDSSFYLCCNCDPTFVFTICLDCVPGERAFFFFFFFFFFFDCLLCGETRRHLSFFFFLAEKGLRMGNDEKKIIHRPILISMADRFFLQWRQ